MHGTNARTTMAGLALLPALWLSSPALSGQDSTVEREVRFVRGLARELGFISLAQEENNRLQREYQDSSDFQHVAQLGIEISLVGAQIYTNRERQRTLYRDAIDRCRELLAAHPDGSVASAAQVTLSDACEKYGLFIVEELELARRESPELVSALEKEAAEVFRIGADACDAAMRTMRGQLNNPAVKLEHGITWLRKGVLLREHGRAVPKDRTALCAFAKDTLEELIFDWGEDTALGLRGLFEYAQCDEVLGNGRDAEAVYEGTIDQLVNTVDQAEDLGLTAQNVEFLLNMMQEIYDRLATLQFESGDTDKVLATAAAFRSRLEKVGVAGADVFETAHERWGHSLFLTEARAKAESGQPEMVSEAMAMVNKINEEHPNDIVGLKAKAVLKDLLEAQTRMVSGPLLFEVAKGEFQKESYEAAINGLKRALAAMSESELAELGQEAYYLMGRAYRTQERYLEAVLAFKTGLERYGDGADDLSQDMAGRLDRVMRSLRRLTRNDLNFNPLNEQVIAVVARMGGEASANQLHWNRASQFYADREFAQAADAYGRITRDFLRYDVSQSRRALSQQLAGDYTGARRTIAGFRRYIETRDGVIADNRTDLQTIRAQALAEMAFTEAMMLYNEATGDEEAGTQKDLTKYPDVIATFQSFIDDYARTGANFLGRAYDVLGRLYSEIGELALAEEAYRNLRSVDSGRTLLPMLGTVIFSSYRTAIENLELEAGSGDPESVAALQQARQKAIDVGLEYARTAPRPSYGMLYNSIRLAETLERWDALDELARLCIARFGDNPEYAQRIDAFVRPAVGRAALEDRKFQQAYDMLSAAAAASPNNFPVKRLLALSLGGWVEIDEVGNPETVMGLDDPVRAYQIYWGEYRTYGLNRERVESYSLPWYEFHWEAYWFARNAAAKDSSFARYAESIYRIAQSIDNFAKLRDEFGSEGRAIWQKFTQFKM